MRVFLLLLFAIFQLNAEGFQLKHIEIDGVLREYVLKFPQNSNNKSKLPLIIALHGGGSTWQKFNRRYNQCQNASKVHSYKVLNGGH